jgi:predicted TPR repeat methyltransferase
LDKLTATKIVSGKVNLTLTSNNDPGLSDLTECIRKETFPHAEGWYRLGNFLIKLGQFNKAQQVYEVMLDHTRYEEEQASVYHIFGRAKEDQYSQSNFKETLT